MTDFLLAEAAVALPMVAKCLLTVSISYADKLNDLVADFLLIRVLIIFHASKLFCLYLMKKSVKYLFQYTLYVGLLVREIRPLRNCLYIVLRTEHDLSKPRVIQGLHESSVTSSLEYKCSSSS
jgi:hypothetical protein